MLFQLIQKYLILHQNDFRQQIDQIIKIIL